MWTKEIPKEEGYYWCKGQDIETEIIFIQNNNDDDDDYKQTYKLLSLFEDTYYISINALEGYEFAGPIPYPENH